MMGSVKHSMHSQSKRIVRFRKIQRLFGLVQPALSQDDIFNFGSKDNQRWKYFKNNY